MIIIYTLLSTFIILYHHLSTVPIPIPIPIPIHIPIHIPILIAIVIIDW